MNFIFTLSRYLVRKVELVRKLVAHGDAREGKWRGNWRTEWAASTLTPPPNVVYPALLKLMRTPHLSAVDRTDAPTDLNGLVRFGERRNLVSARVPSRSARARDFGVLHSSGTLRWVGCLLIAEVSEPLSRSQLSTSRSPFFLNWPTPEGRINIQY